MPGGAFDRTSMVTVPSGLSLVGCVPGCTLIGLVCGLWAIGSNPTVTFCFSGETHVTFTGSVTLSPCLTVSGSVSFSSLPFTFTVALSVSAASLKNPFSGRTASTAD